MVFILNKTTSPPPENPYPEPSEPEPRPTDPDESGTDPDPDLPEPDDTDTDSDVDELRAVTESAGADTGAALAGCLAGAFTAVNHIELAGAAYWRDEQNARHLDDAVTELDQLAVNIKLYAGAQRRENQLRTRLAKVDKDARRRVVGTNEAVRAATLRFDREQLRPRGKNDRPDEPSTDDLAAISATATAVAKSLRAASRDPKSLFTYLAGSADPSRVELLGNELLSQLLNALVAANRAAAWSRLQAVELGLDDPTG